MKKIALLLFCLLSFGAYADGQYACITGESAGLNWENNRWKVAKFFPVNILISVKANGTMMEYKAAGDNLSSKLTCSRYEDSLLCTTFYGKTVMFNEATLLGGSSSLLGAVSKGNEKDSLAVSTLTCQKF